MHARQVLRVYGEILIISILMTMLCASGDALDISFKSEDLNERYKLKDQSVGVLLNPYTLIFQAISRLTLPHDHQITAEG